MTTINDTPSFWRKLARLATRVLLIATLGTGALAAAVAYLIWVPHYRPFAENPSAATLGEIHFFALGDQGSGKPAQWLIAHGMEKVAEQQDRLDFVALLGDNFYSRGIDSSTQIEWLSRFENVYRGRFLEAVPFFAVLGNHDHMGNPAAELDYAREHRGSGRWRMPNWYYSQDFGKSGQRPLLRIVFIDTVRGPDELAEQAAFIERQFAESPTAPVWKMVIGHYPVRNHGKHGLMPEMLQVILPAMQRAGVDFYLSGHDHDQQIIARDGEPAYAISGAGGAELYDIRETPDELRFSRSAHGFLGVDIDETTLTVTPRDAWGTPEARFTLDRRCAKGMATCLRKVG